MKDRIKKLIDRLVSNSLLRIGVLDWLRRVDVRYHESVHPWITAVQGVQDKRVLPVLDGLSKQMQDQIVPWLNNLQAAVNNLQAAVNSLEACDTGIIRRLERDDQMQVVADIARKCASGLGGISREYKDFEDHMRGSRDEIRTRLQTYEPFVKKVLANANGGKCVALDLGCGRGEWLQFLNDRHSIQGIGIDKDEEMVATCRQLGLHVYKCDVLDYLWQAESDSVDLVSMFQVAEHLDWTAFDNVLVEIRRILRPGGGIIVETPNPENMIVGACNFYFDPTHVRQIPPPLMKNVFEYAGFDDVEIVRSNRYPAACVESLGEGTAENVIREVASFFNNFADYAALGFKGK